MKSLELIVTPDENGKIVIQLPDDFPKGDIRIHLDPINTELDEDDLLTPDPKTGAEIARSDAIGGWADLGIPDSVEWVEQVRREEVERRKWQSD